VGTAAGTAAGIALQALCSTIMSKAPKGPSNSFPATGAGVNS